MIEFDPTTPIQFYKKDGTYVPGSGQTTAWVDLGLLYCEWKGAFGDRATAAQALGVNDSARVRTFYHPTIYAALKSDQVVVIKNADATGIKDGAPDRSNPNVYELWGGVDNVEEANQRLEFKVRRYQGT